MELYEVFHVNRNAVMGTTAVKILSLVIWSGEVG